MKLKFLLLICINSALLATVEFKLIITSYNNEQWCVQNLETLCRQTYQNWIAYYINDCSTDTTEKIVTDYIDQHALENKIIYISNNSKKYKIRNMYEIVQSLPDESVVVVYDGDDWFAHENVLARIAMKYEDAKTWVTYGTYKDEPGEQHAFPVSPNSDFRKPPAVFNILPGHPFTFYAWLFKKIAYEDFIINGVVFPKAGSDMIFIPPIMEMARYHFKHIPEVLYIHNCITSLNDHKVNSREQGETTKACMKKKPYDPL